MKVYALWHGGVNYAHGYVDTDVERFDTLGEAIGAFNDRRLHGHWIGDTFRYVNREEERAYTPNVEGSYMFLWREDPTGDPDPYPWRIVEEGPRGGTRVVNA